MWLDETGFGLLRLDLYVSIVALYIFRGHTAKP